MGSDQSGQNIIAFTHEACPYYPCHGGVRQLNCLFCFCPLHHRPKCPGRPQWLPDGTKDCSACLFPHLPVNFSRLMALINQKLDV